MKVAVITGAAQGIGRRTAEVLAEAGYALAQQDVGVSYRRRGDMQSAAIHALTAGAIGTMILAVMTRATRGHTGRALVADPATTAIYVLVTLAAIARVAAAFATVEAMGLLILSAGLWIAAFVGFLLAYGPMLLGSRPPRADR